VAVPPPPEAVTVTWAFALTGNVVTLNKALADPLVTVIGLGVDAAAVFELESETLKPAVGAGPFRSTSFPLTGVPP
jgi:hypothetical protein